MAHIADDKAPMSAWRRQAEPFERLANCEQARRKVVQDELDYMKSTAPKEHQTLSVLAACIATDDPRLKGN